MPPEGKLSDAEIVDLERWFGRTFTCARCRDHKFDPIMREDYYISYRVI